MVIKLSQKRVSYYYSVYKKHVTEVGMCLTVHFSQRFVNRILTYYYKDDADVKKDTELHKWISDIFEHGFLSRVIGHVYKKLNLSGDVQWCFECTFM